MQVFEFLSAARRKTLTMLATEHISILRKSVVAAARELNPVIGGKPHLPPS